MLVYIKKTSATIFGDRSLWHGDMTRSVCINMALGEALHLRLSNAILLAYCANSAMRMLRTEPESDITAMTLMYEGMIATSAKRIDMFRHYVHHMRRRQSEEVSHIAEEAKNRTLVASLCGSTLARAAKRTYRLDGCISNKDVFTDGVLTGVNMRLLDGEDKLSRVERHLYMHGILIRHCAVVGGSISDIPLMMEADISIAAPHAPYAVKSIASVQMEQYGVHDSPHQTFAFYSNRHAGRGFEPFDA